MLRPADLHIFPPSRTRDLVQHLTWSYSIPDIPHILWKRQSVRTFGDDHDLTYLANTVSTTAEALRGYSKVI